MLSSVLKSLESEGLRRSMLIVEWNIACLCCVGWFGVLCIVSTQVAGFLYKLNVCLLRVIWRLQEWFFLLFCFLFIMSNLILFGVY